jgi:hypothetical protein
MVKGNPFGVARSPIAEDYTKFIDEFLDTMNCKSETLFV